MHMLWYLPLALGTGLACSREALVRRKAARRDGRNRDWWALLFLGWIPTLAWILSQRKGQY